MNTSINLKFAPLNGFCRDTDGLFIAAPARARSFFYAKLQVYLMPSPACQNGGLRDYNTKVKHLTEFNGTTTAKPIKESCKRHLLKPYAFKGVGGFCSKPKGTSWAEWLHETRRFIKRWCFL